MNCIVFVLLFLFPFVGGNPFQQPLFGFRQLFEPQFIHSSVRASQNFHHEDDNGYVHLEYNVEKTDKPIIHLDEERVMASIDTLQCKKREIVINFHSASVAEKFVLGMHRDDLITGTNWPCTNDGKPYSFVLARVVKYARNQKRVYIQTEEASYNHFFRHANISFSLNKYPSDYFTQYTFKHPKRATPSATRDSECSNILKCAWEAVEDLGDNVVEAASSVYETVKDITSGEIVIDQSIKGDVASWNYEHGDVKKTFKFGDYVTCKKCYAVLDLQLDFLLRIENHEVQELTMAATGDATIAAEVLLGFQAFSSLTEKYDVGLVHSPTIPFTVFGIPFTLEVSVAVSGGFSLAAQASAVRVQSSATGSLKYGVHYTPSAGWSQISEQELVPTGSVSVGLAAVSGVATVFIQPTIMLIVDKVGGPFVGIKHFVELSAAVGTNVCEGKGVQVDLNWGNQVTVGFFAEIEVLGNVVLPKQDKYWTVVSTKRPLYSQCETIDIIADALFDSSAQVSATTQIFPGHTWYGVLTPDSEGISSIAITFQYLNPTSVEYHYEFMIAFNFVMDDQSQCFGQVAYDVSLEAATDGYAMIMKPILLANGDADGWIECSVQNWYVDQQSTAFISSDLTSISIDDALLKRF